MPESFFHLSAKEQEEALQVAASASGRPAHLLEKDIWVVWALSTLFTFRRALEQMLWLRHTR
jgi:hypothetical protein